MLLWEAWEGWRYFNEEQLVKSTGGRFFGPSRAGTACVLVRSRGWSRSPFGSVPAASQSITWIIRIWPLVTFKEISLWLCSKYAAKHCIDQNIKFVRAESNIVLSQLYLLLVGICCGQADSWERLWGTSARVHGSRTGWMCVAVAGRERWNAGWAPVLFLLVSAKCFSSFHLRAGGQAGYTGWKTPVGNAVSFQTVLVIRACSRAVCGGVLQHSSWY